MNFVNIINSNDESTNATELRWEFELSDKHLYVNMNGERILSVHEDGFVFFYKSDLETVALKVRVS